MTGGVSCSAPLVAGNSTRTAGLKTTKSLFFPAPLKSFHVEKIWEKFFLNLFLFILIQIICFLKNRQREQNETEIQAFPDQKKKTLQDIGRQKENKNMKIKQVRQNWSNKASAPESESTKTKRGQFKGTTSNFSFHPFSTWTSNNVYKQEESRQSLHF